jgi:hypothetical protein
MPEAVSRMDFLYLSPEAAAAADAASAAARGAGMAEYAALKETLLRRTWRFGALFAGYLLLGVSAESAAAELVGAAASYGYLRLLIADVDAFGPETAVPLKAAELVEMPLPRAGAKLLAAWAQAARPRLLVPVGLLAAAAAWNAAFPDARLGLLEEGCLLGGFLAYKSALILKVYDDLRPRARSEAEMAAELRPEMPAVDDVEWRVKRPSERRAEAAAAEAAEAAAAEAEAAGRG